MPLDSGVEYEVTVFACEAGGKKSLHNRPWFCSVCLLTISVYLCFLDCPNGYVKLASECFRIPLAQMTRWDTGSSEFTEVCLTVF